MISMELGTWESVDAIKEIFTEYLAAHPGEDTLTVKICAEFITYANEQRRIHDTAIAEGTDEVRPDDNTGDAEGSAQDAGDTDAVAGEDPED